MDETKKIGFYELPEVISLSESSETRNERAEEYKKQVEQIAQEQRFEKYKNSGIAAKFYAESLETYLPRNEAETLAKDIVAGFCKNPSNRILLLYGKNGNGKTHLAAGALRAVGGRYITSSDLCVEFESGSDFKAKRNKLDILGFYSSLSPLLVIDECMTYFRQDLEQFILSRIVCQRYENNAATILVTNEDKREFLQFIGKAAFDRMTEVCTSISFQGESYRLRRRQNNGLCAE